MVDLGIKIKALRQERHMTQQQLADRLGLTKSVVSAYENSIRYPSYEILIYLAQLFNVSTDYLLGMKNGATIDISGLTPEDVDLVYQLISRLKTSY